MTVYEVYRSLKINDRKVLFRAAQQLREYDKANNIKRPKIQQLEGRINFMVNFYPSEMEAEIKDALFDAVEFFKVVEEVPVEVIATPKKRIMRKRIKNG